MLFPNPRGSYGQGEKFTRANVKDFGDGDLRDILAGVDEVLHTAPVDPARVGIGGWSYGGYMTMWTVTQTNRFQAAVAGAGIANWQSYYGQNSIDQWMIPFFGGFGLRRPRGLCQEFAHHVYQEGQDADPDPGRRSRRRVPAAAVVRVLARSQNAGREDGIRDLSERRPSPGPARAPQGCAGADHRLVQREPEVRARFSVSR